MLMQQGQQQRWRQCRHTNEDRKRIETAGSAAAAAAVPAKHGHKLHIPVYCTYLCIARTYVLHVRCMHIPM